MKKRSGQKLNDNAFFGQTATKKASRNEKMAKISFFLAIINSLVWLVDVLALANGAPFGPMTTIYYMSLIGFIVNILTIIFGTFGIRSSKKGLAIASITLTITPFLLLLIIIPLSLTHS